MLQYVRVSLFDLLRLYNYRVPKGLENLEK